MSLVNLPPQELQVVSAVGQSRVLNNPARQRLVVLLREGYRGIEQPELAALRGVLKKLNYLVVIARQAVADNHYSFSLRHSGLGALPDRTKNRRWLLATDRSYDDGVSSDGGTAIVIMNDPAAAIGP
jgi:hypothetical protein